MAWDLGLKTKRRQHPYGRPEQGLSWRKGHWEILTGWSDDMGEEDEDEDEVVGSDGDILGEVVDTIGRRRRATQANANSTLPEHAWEIDVENTSFSVRN